MAKVQITLLNQHYPIYCPDGQENHIHDLAQKLNDRLLGVKEYLPTNIGDVTLLIYIALQLLDEAEDNEHQYNNMIKKINLLIEDIDNKQKKL